MLTNGNQYLRPEYLITPLPTTLDAKKSPLALLAQTCSQIGADPSGKSLLASLDGKASSGKSSKTSGEQSREKSSPAAPQQPQVQENVKSSFKPYEPCLGREKASTPEEPRAASSHSTSGRSRTPGSGGSKRCSSNQSASSARAATPLSRRTGTPNNEAARESPASRAGSGSTAAQTTASDPSLTSSQPQASSPMLSKSAYSPNGVNGMMDSSIKDLSLGTFKTGSSMPASTSSGYLGYPTQLPIDVLSTALTSQHHAALKNGLTSNPYMSYARMKTSSGADTLVPICRDPYCTGCQLNPHYMASANTKVPTSSAAGSCPAGCLQCDHKPSVSPYGSMSPHTSASYAHAQLAAMAAASQMPYVCSWITGEVSNSYCGKRFSSSEELLQHLRSHTSTSAADPATAAALSLLAPSLGLTHPMLSRTYPSTPPLSPLAAARYHPYAKPSPLMQPSLSTLGYPFPAHHPSTPLQPYFSPYSLYGMARLGSASGMHP